MDQKSVLSKQVIDQKYKSVLEVRNLCTSISNTSDEFELLSNINFKIKQNETLALVGESGSGKSVTALSITRLLDEKYSKIQGSVLLEDQELLKLSEKEMKSLRGRKFGMVFQEALTSLNPLKSVGSQIAEVLFIHRFMRKTEAELEAVRLLDQVRIPAANRRSKELPGSLSGGMRQRVMIAMALACKPKLLIADEPTTALDVTVQAQILSLIKEMQEEIGMAVLFITHDMGIVAEIADFTMVMQNGRQIESGKTSDIFSAPQSKYTKELIASVPILKSHLKKGNFPVPSVNNEGVSMRFDQKLKETPKYQNSKPILSVRNLIKRFDVSYGLLGKVTGRIHAVEDVSFNLFPGQTLSLVGESGCGKSTTARTVMRLLEAEGGRIEIDGKDILKIEAGKMREMRRHLQMIFQDPFASLNPKLSVGFSVAEPFLTHGLGTKVQAKKRVSELLELVGIDPKSASRFPQQFSGGQRQRICIARALILQPKLIIADEAVSSLDVSTKSQVVDLLMKLQKEFKVSYLFISHDIAIVERISHHVAVMYQGEIVEMAPIDKIFSNPRHSYTKKLISSVPIPDPSRRYKKINLAVDEPQNPIRSPSYAPIKKKYRTYSDDHLVQIEV